MCICFSITLNCYRSADWVSYRLWWWCHSCGKLFDYPFSIIFQSSSTIWYKVYNYGRTAGELLRTITGLSSQVPVVDGYSFPHLTKRMNVAGRHITSYLVDLLSRRGWGPILCENKLLDHKIDNQVIFFWVSFCRYAMNRTADFETVREIKEKLCYIRWIFMFFSRFMNLTYKIEFDTTSILMQLWLQKGISTGTWDHHPC